MNLRSSGCEPDGIHPQGIHWCICWFATPPLPFGERRDELAAEGRDVRDHAAPDRVGIGRETLEHVSEGLLEWTRTASLLRLV